VVWARDLRVVVIASRAEVLGEQTQKGVFPGEIGPFCVCSPVELDLDDDGAALSATGTHRRHSDAAAPALQLVDQRGDHPRA
jgi:hypothetical protein